MCGMWVIGIVFCYLFARHTFAEFRVTGGARLVGQRWNVFLLTFSLSIWRVLLRILM